MNCQNCNEPLETLPARFCPHCGAPVSLSPSSPPKSPTSQSNHDQPVTHQISSAHLRAARKSRPRKIAMSTQPSTEKNTSGTSQETSTSGEKQEPGIAPTRNVLSSPAIADNNKPAPNDQSSSTIQSKFTTTQPSQSEKFEPIPETPVLEEKPAILKQSTHTVSKKTAPLSNEKQQKTSLNAQKAVSSHKKNLQPDSTHLHKDSVQGERSAQPDPLPSFKTEIEQKINKAKDSSSAIPLPPIPKEVRTIIEAQPTLAISYDELKAQAPQKLQDALDEARQQRQQPSLASQPGQHKRSDIGDQATIEMPIHELKQATNKETATPTAAKHSAPAQPVNIPEEQRKAEIEAQSTIAISKEELERARASLEEQQSTNQTQSTENREDVGQPAPDKVASDQPHNVTSDPPVIDLNDQKTRPMPPVTTDGPQPWGLQPEEATEDPAPSAQVSPFEPAQPLLYYRLNTSNRRSQMLPAVVNTTHKRQARGRTSRGKGWGCAITALLIVVALLVIVGAAWFFGVRPYLHTMTETQLNKALDKAVGLVEPPSLFLPGVTVPVTEDNITQVISNNLAPANPVKNPHASITNQHVRLDFQVYGYDCAVTMVPQVINNQLQVTGVTVEGVLALVESGDEMASTLNNHLIEAQQRLKHNVSAVQLKNHELDLTLA